jgi:hypothetical protein
MTIVGITGRQRQASVCMTERFRSGTHSSVVGEDMFGYGGAERLAALRADNSSVRMMGEIAL